MKMFTKKSSLSGAYRSMVLLFAFLFVWTACSDESQINELKPQASSSAAIDATAMGATSQSFPESTVTLADGSNYTVASSVSWYGSTTTWTYTITGASTAKNISHVNFFGFDNCFWNNIASAEGLSLTKEPTSTGCFSADQQVIKYTPANSSEQRTITFTWTFNKALAVNTSAASVYVKAATSCESVSIPGPSCTELAISGNVSEKVCADSKTNIQAVAGKAVSAKQGTDVRSTVTDENGNYSFTNLGGEWVISVETADDQKTAAGPDNGSASFVLDNRPNQSCAVVSGIVEKLSCTENTTTSTKAGLSVSLKANGTVVSSTTTDETGGYKFSNVAPGQYSVESESIAKSVNVTVDEGSYTVDNILADTRPNGSCASIIGTITIMECFQQSSVTRAFVGATVTCEHGSCQSQSGGVFRFDNVSPMMHDIFVENIKKSVDVKSTDGVYDAGNIIVDRTNGGVCGSGPVACSLSQGYWFAKPQAVWPAGSVTIGGKTYTQAEGKAIWNTSNSRGLLNAKAAFLQASAIKLSNVAATASVWADVQIIDNYLASIAKLAPGAIPANSRTGANAAAGAAAGRIGNWINANHCAE